MLRTPATDLRGLAAFQRGEKREKEEEGEGIYRVQRGGGILARE
jgi:hypothetical protein